MLLHDRAITLNDLANIYAMKMQYTKAVERYREALALYIELAKDEPIRYGLAIAYIFSNLSIIYLQLGKVEKSESLHVNALKMHRSLAKHNIGRYGLTFVECLVDGVLHLKQHSFTLYEAEMILNQIRGHQKEREELVEVIRKLHTTSVD